MKLHAAQIVLTCTMVVSALIMLLTVYDRSNAALQERVVVDNEDITMSGGKMYTQLLR